MVEKGGGAPRKPAAKCPHPGKKLAKSNVKGSPLRKK